MKILSYCIKISIVVLACTTAPCSVLAKKVSPFLAKKGNIVQLKALNQTRYELHATKEDLNKPDILDGYQGFCGLFATYNAYCLLKALDTVDKHEAHQHLSNLYSVESFHDWIKQCKPVLKNIKESRGDLGNFTNYPILQIARFCFSPQECNRFHCFDTEGLKYCAQGKSEGYLKTYAFFKQLKSSTEPHVAVFLIGSHWICVAFTLSKTWIIDSLNVSRINHKDVRNLITFIRKDSLSAQLGFNQSFTDKFLSTPRKGISKIINACKNFNFKNFEAIFYNYP